MLMHSSQIDLASFIACPNANSKSLDQNLANILRVVREHLGLEVMFISEFEAGQRIFRHVDAEDPETPLKVGGSDPLEKTYCQRVIDGRLPPILIDAMLHPEASELAKAAAMSIGAHISVPIRLKNGDIYGTFCGFSASPDETLNARDLDVMKVFAELVAMEIDQEILNHAAMIEARDRIADVLANDSLRMVYQPIFDIKDNVIVGYESLARFTTEPARTPDVWFDEAATVGFAAELEMKAMLQGLNGIAVLPQERYVSVNTSPSTLLSCDPYVLFEGFPLDRIVLEITEHAIVEDYPALYTIMQTLKARGLRLAVDDAGAGYASFRHILRLAPDIIKLDISITRDIDKQQSNRALAAAMVGFAHETNATIVAEGVETANELATLADLGITKAQGYLLGMPMALDGMARF